MKKIKWRTLLFLFLFGSFSIEVYAHEIKRISEKKSPIELITFANKHRTVLLRTYYEKNRKLENLTIDFTNAIDLYKEALTIDPNLAFGYLSFGSFYTVASQVFEDANYYDRAKIYLYKSLELKQGYRKTYFQLFQLFSILQEWENADKYLKAYGVSAQEDSYIHNWLAYRLAQSKNYKEAEKEMESAVKKNSSYLSVKWAEKYLGRAKKIDDDDFPPLKTPIADELVIHPVSTRMNIEILAFEDRTGEAGDFTDIFTNLLASGLFNSGRFSVLFKENRFKEFYLAGRESAGNEVDAVLYGNFILIDKKEKKLTLDLKIMLPDRGNILFAETISIPYRKKRDQGFNGLLIEGVNKVINNLEKAFVKTEGRIIAINGKYITVNRGSKDGIKEGLKAFIIGKNQEMYHPETKELLGEVNNYLGEVSFIRVGERLSEAQLLNNRRITIKIGNRVMLK